MIHFAPLVVMMASTLLSAADGAPLDSAPSKVGTAQRTARMGSIALTQGMAALAAQDPDAEACFPEDGSALTRAAALLACTPEAVGKGAKTATGVAATLGGLFALGTAVPMMVDETLSTRARDDGAQGK